MEKTIVMLVLCRRVIADLLIKSLERKGNVHAFGIYDYKNAVMTAESRKPSVALIEIPERHGAPAQEMLIISEGIKEKSPGCKVVLLCPEQDKNSVNISVEAKKQGKVEDFLFYDSGVDYLVSKLEALYPE